MFETLPPALKSFAVRTKVKYAPHPYVWMSSARAKPTGLGLETEGKEIPLDQLPEWSEEHIKTFPMLWKNPVTGKLHLQVHPCGAMELHVEPKAGAEFFPDGAVITDLAEVRGWLEKVQRPGIDPKVSRLNSRELGMHGGRTTHTSSFTPSTGPRAILSSSTTAASCTALPAPSGPTTCACSTSATWPPAPTLSGLMRRTSRSMRSARPRSSGQVSTESKPSRRQK